MKRRNREAGRTVKKIKGERRGRPKKRWLDAIGSDMRTVGTYINDVGDRVKWKFRTWVIDRPK